MSYGLPLYAFQIIMYVIFLLMLTIMASTYPSCIHDDVYEYYRINNKTNCHNLINNSNDETFVRK